MDPIERGSDEIARIRHVYDEREKSIPWDRYSVASAGALFIYQQRVREVTRLLHRSGYFPLDDVRILDVGCGRGGWLVDFETWGASQANLAGADIDPARIARARERLRDADLRVVDGRALPWPDGSFDLVLQSTVFTSILDAEVRRQLAEEMTRVLAPGGAVLWYDFHRNNPRNPDVRGVTGTEVRALFPGFGGRLRRVTLAPPLSRRLAPVWWTGAHVLERMRFLNTHYLGLLRRT